MSGLLIAVLSSSLRVEDVACLLSSTISSSFISWATVPARVSRVYLPIFPFFIDVYTYIVPSLSDLDHFIPSMGSSYPAADSNSDGFYTMFLALAASCSQQHAPSSIMLRHFTLWQCRSNNIQSFGNGLKSGTKTGGKTASLESKLVHL